MQPSTHAIEPEPNPADDPTRGRLLREAAKLFALQGYEGVSLRQIAESVDIRAASIFHHFPNGKAELYEAILRTVTDTMQARIAPDFGADEGLGTEDRIVLMAAAFWDFFADFDGFAALILRESFDENPDTPESVLLGARVIMDNARELIEQSQCRGELAGFDIDGFLLWSIMHSISYHAAPGLRTHVVSAGRTADADRRHYLLMVRAHLRDTFATPVA